MGIDHVAGELCALRTRIQAQRANGHEWPTKEEELVADLDRYDRRLLKAAAMLQVHAPQPARDSDMLLTDDERRGLEARLAASGLDVQSATGDSGASDLLV